MMKGRFERFVVQGVLWVVIGAFLVLLVFFAGAVWEVRGKQHNALVERENARQAFEETQTRHQKLTEDVERFQSERGIEGELRERFPVAKEGEEVIILVNAKEAPPASSPASSGGFWALVQGLFRF